MPKRPPWRHHLVSPDEPDGGPVALSTLSAKILCLFQPPGQEKRGRQHLEEMDRFSGTCVYKICEKQLVFLLKCGKLESWRATARDPGNLLSGFSHVAGGQDIPYGSEEIPSRPPGGWKQPRRE